MKFLKLGIAVFTGALLGLPPHFSFSQESNSLFSGKEDTAFVEPFHDYEHIPDFTYSEIEARVKKMETDMPFELNETIFSFIDYFVVRNRTYTKMMLARRDQYFPLFEEALRSHNMPEDIKFLAIVESGLNPKARSRVGAMGLWQFMPGTGREYQLYTNQDIDDRMDPEMSTEAAMRFLKNLYRRFGDWELALAAYNCGPGNVNKAIRRSGGKKNFWEIYRFLPRETRSYIPQFQAIMYVLRHPEYHNFILEEDAYPIHYEKIAWEAELDLEKLVEVTDICLEDLQMLNPALLSNKAPANRKNKEIRIPSYNFDYLVENQYWIRDSLKVQTERLLAENVKEEKEVEKPQIVTQTLTYRVKPGDVLGKIAQQFNVPLSNLKAWNGLNSNVIKVGQVLQIHQDESAFNKNIASSTSAKEMVEQENGSKTYTVQPGDSLWLISRKLEGVSIEQLKRLNNLNNNQIKPGQKLIIG
ncbi:lytic transglycosylase domain-containing protein [Pleomorphovibrio marinus]|uniref:lytic transglycosylase domain-containing protein n=1 Tax=Pleomorphovibrio marinus TaxID=2164132 RepID=UPI000E0C12C2|nr:lytic transglycosylase domain-containing protein [Pleomorphovibrio marinus]